MARLGKGHMPGYGMPTFPGNIGKLRAALLKTGTGDASLGAICDHLAAVFEPELIWPKTNDLYPWARGIRFEVVESDSAERVIVAIPAPKDLASDARPIAIYFTGRTLPGHQRIASQAVRLLLDAISLAFDETTGS